MARQAIFGPPLREVSDGGALITAHLVPVHEGRLVAFDITARVARGRWLPWTTLEYGGNPYETASALADEWCGGPVSDLRLVDIMSFTLARTSWELAIVFRAELTSLPPRTADRAPAVYPAGEFDAIGPFDPVDLQRWVGVSVAPPPPAAAPPPPADDAPGNRLVF